VLLNQKECLSKLNWDISKKHILFASNPKNRVKNYSLAEAAFSLLNDASIEMHALSDVPSEQVPIYFNAADVVLLTSNYEGSPNVIKEALACNCPIVATDVGDIKENIEGIEGCFITSFDAEDVARKIKLALQFGKRTNAREKIKHLSDEVIAKKIIDFYHRVKLN